MAERVIRGTPSTIKKAVQLAVGPDLDAIKKDLSDVKGDVRVFGVTQESMKKELLSEIRRAETKMDEMDKRLSSELRGVSQKVDVLSDIETLKLKVAELEKRS